MKKLLISLILLSNLVKANIPPVILKTLQSDKYWHSTVGAFIGSSSYFASYMMTKRIGFSWGVSITNGIVAGNGKEIYDMYKPNKTGYNLDDMLLTSYGSVTGAFTCFIIIDLKKQDNIDKKKLIEDYQFNH